MSIFDKIASYLGTPVKEVGKQFQRDTQASVEFPEQSIIGLTNASKAVQGGIEDASVYAINKEKELGVPEGIANLDALPSVISRMALPQTEEETGAMLATPLVNPVAKFMVEEGGIAGKGMYQGGKALVDKIAGSLPPPPSAMEPALAEGLHIPNVTVSEPTIPSGIQVSNTMIGKNAKGFDPTAPGTFTNVFDKKVRQEIPDNTMRVNIPIVLSKLKAGKEAFRMADILEHPKLFSAYPELQKIPVYILKDTHGQNAYYAPKSKQMPLEHIVINEKLFKDKNITNAKKAILHELQHAIQEREGFTRGQVAPNASYDEYFTNAGEIEARDTANRLNFPQEVRQILSPYTGEEIPVKNWKKDSIFKKGLRASKEEDTSVPPFYSYLEQTVQDKMPTRMAGKDLQGLLTNAAVKKEELQYSGMEDLFEKPMVTKQEVMDHLQANKIELKEITLGNRPDGTSHNPYLPMQEGDMASPKFEAYQLPGGKNYKEMLFQLPKKEGPRQKHFIVEDQVTGDSQEFSTQSEVDAYLKTAPNPEDTTVNRLSDVVPEFKDTEYQSSHFDEPNILAHTRFNEVKDAQGKKVLRIEEIQSDWHQEGRDTGYKNDTKARLEELNARAQELAHKPELTPAEEQEFRTTEQLILEYKNPAYHAPGVLDAPFKKNWHEMVMRRMIRYAAENGFDKIAWTTGEQQVKRYPGLIKAFDSIAAELKPNGTYDIYGAPRNDHQRLMGNFTEEKLTGAVGKDLAQKIVQQKGGEFKGLDLKVGDHGMKVFYDEMLPSYANKFTKKWGGQVVDEKFGGKGKALSTADKAEVRQTLREVANGNLSREEANDNLNGLYELSESVYENLESTGRDRASRSNETSSYITSIVNNIAKVNNEKAKYTLHTLTITPEMKRAALTKGFPLFSGAAMLNYLNDGKEEKKKGVQ